MPWIIPSTPSSPAPAPTIPVVGGPGDPPQFDAPFRIASNGQVVTVDQDSPEEIGAAIYNVVTCPQGAKFNEPDFGCPSPIFDVIPLKTDGIVKAVQAHEPRASIEAVQEKLILVQGSQPVNLDITAQVQGS